ncbi:rhombosortase [Pseudoalteromonas phenolica]|uniref:Rhombosortase n=1 Tax=Pseudoalteromonas phenolica TaxID=161398 RepID=A0A5R9Q612_9GAMM|nr:rhombosortase [Pseudoalteromonas phenolica]TLX48588.1 rhombosortase [Pseudoalteromonas phenolica]
MIQLPLDKKYILPPIMLSLLSFTLMILNTNDLLEFHRDKIAAGEIWRIFTGQFVHANPTHLLLNIVGIGFIWLLHAEHRSQSQYYLHTAFLALWTGLGIWLFVPDIKVYTGLSGLLHGVIVWGALKDIQVGMRSGILLFVGIWAKLAWEQWAGPSADVGELIQSRVAIEAHLIGAIGGLVMGLGLIKNKLKNKSEKKD